MSREKVPVTPAIRVLRENGVEFVECPYKYEDKGGTAVSARELGVDEHSVIKTLVMEDEGKQPLVVLMHGDKEVSTKELARLSGVKRISPCTPDTAHKHTGYMVGGISTLRHPKAHACLYRGDYIDPSRIYINGGRRGFLVGLDPREIRTYP